MCVTCTTRRRTNARHRARWAGLPPDYLHNSKPHTKQPVKN
nr:MAG TPA_asm: hypothetical protein [Caudoviricetes sp.]